MTRPRYPFIPGHRAVDTSMAAAEDLAPRLPSLQRTIFDRVVEAAATGATCDEIAAQLGCERWAVRPRISELRKMGAITDSGQRRVNGASGKFAIVWILPAYREIVK